MYREDDLTLTKLIEVVSSCHDTEVLVIVKKPDEVNRSKQKDVHHTEQWHNLCWLCNDQIHFAKQYEMSKGHTCERCGIKGHLKVCCRTKQDQRGGVPLLKEDVENNTRTYER